MFHSHFSCFRKKFFKLGVGCSCLILFPFLGNFDQDGVAAEECDDPDHDQVLEGDEHVQLEPEAIVETEDGTLNVKYTIFCQKSLKLTYCRF